MRKNEIRYREKLKAQAEKAARFLDRETENANDLLTIFRNRRLEMGDDIYRSAAFFVNREWERKIEAVPILMTACERLHKELPPVTRENAIDQLCYKFRVYTQVLQQGGFNGID
jgi:hypothetical protein